MRLLRSLPATVFGLWAFPVASATLSPEDAAGHIGETATVCGAVVSDEYEADVRLSRRYWTWGGRFRMRRSLRSFTAIIGGNSEPPRRPFGASASV